MSSTPASAPPRCAMCPICVPPTACAALPVVMAAWAVTSCAANGHFSDGEQTPRSGSSNCVSQLAACFNRKSSSQSSLLQKHTSAPGDTEGESKYVETTKGRRPGAWLSSSTLAATAT